METNKIYLGNAYELIKELPDKSIDLIITDPPYELGFMGKKWDSTGKAVAFENRERHKDYKYIGIELEKQYCEISELRIDYAINKYEYDIIKEDKERHDKGEYSVFDFYFD